MNLDKLEPRETSGSSTQARYSFQVDYIAYQCIRLLEHSNLVEVYCDFHSDCVVKDDKDFLTFFQVKGIKNRLFNESDLKATIPDMFSNYKTAQGNCKCVLVTNASLGKKLRDIMRYRENKNNNVATSNELSKLNKIMNEWRKLIKDPKGVFNKFFEEFNIHYELPSFFETKKTNEMTLKDFNINKFKSVLDKTLKNNYELEDVNNIYDMIIKEVQSRSKLTTRFDRTISKENLLEKIQIPSYQRMLFDAKFTYEQIEKIKDQTILQGKLKQGGFDDLFIKNAKLVRCMTRYYREKASKMKANRSLINDFEYRLNNICLDVFEKHQRKEKYDSLDMLEELEAKLVKLALEEKYQSLNVEPDFVRGLIWEATSQCNFRWDKK